VKKCPALQSLYKVVYTVDAMTSICEIILTFSGEITSGLQACQ